MKLDAVSQMEGVDLAVLGHVPAFGERRSHFRRARFEFHQPVEDRLGSRIHGGIGRSDHRIERLRARLRAVDQRLGIGLPAKQNCRRDERGAQDQTG
ncbi:hypothetical protein D9M72_639760 [compost metagenome]